MSVQEIVVYRNPFEAAAWEAVSSGAALPFFLWVFLFLTTILFLNVNFNKPFDKHPGAFVVGALIFASTSTWVLMNVV